MPPLLKPAEPGGGCVESIRGIIWSTLLFPCFLSLPLSLSLALSLSLSLSLSFSLSFLFMFLVSFIVSLCVSLWKIISFFLLVSLYFLVGLSPFFSAEAFHLKVGVFFLRSLFWVV